MKHAAAYVLYWLGHVTSKVLEAVEAEWWGTIWYPVYNWFMLTSSDLDTEGRIWKDDEQEGT